MSTASMLRVNWRPDRRQLRWFGGMALVAFGAFGAWVFFRGSIFGFGLGAGAARATGVILWVLGGGCGMLAALAPKYLRGLYVVLMAAAIPIGFVVSHAVIALLFYVIVTPLALFLRLRGRDPLCRRFDPDAETYWVPRKPTTDVRRYFRQS